MTEKIYEYKDEKNWFIGTWAGFNYFTCFGDDAVFEAVQKDFHHLLDQLQVSGLQIHVASYDSSFYLLSFLVDMITDKTGRSIKLRQQADALLIIEEEKLVSVHLPESGVKLTDFFGRQVDTLADLGDTILIATKNEGKTKEFRQFFAKLGYQVENLNNYPDISDVEETGVTFEENARLKAETIANLTGKMVLADDSGLKVDVLGGLPGVWSARFSGLEATDETNNAKLLHELAMVFEQKNRSAQFHCTLVVAAPHSDSLVVEADWEGYIGMELRGEHGFGYDPLFLVGETGRTSAEMTLEEKNKISHRAKALEKLMEAFPSWQKKQVKPF
ncbi:deoxyribonucleotide triphosphate pyrophosphatase/unknown domain fusion protein [Streptococcus varani]|uniref:dITP/XTP pyrophosphatase n=1 Tax=Streptococcus varani TaxID=1608583 RepID=A0A0E3WEU7_9STRE|nr:nucleoside-triphosphate diphosphatase [Streptococcus varani]CQR24328.1 deoxyribonucleotide triphosphate pyrophosphatase/unknown domain fusion protein [Streptococcus varani]